MWLSAPNEVVRMVLVTDAEVLNTLEEMMMNKDIAAGKWAQLKGTLKATWGDLTDDDLTKISGNAQKLIGILQEKYGRTKEQAQKEVAQFWEKH
jgi:uncharacterized protein YjbJ (UPF0337 family)